MILKLLLALKSQKIKIPSDGAAVAGFALVSWDDGENGGQAGLAEADIIIAGGEASVPNVALHGILSAGYAF